jgi:hypothetical protein
MFIRASPLLLKPAALYIQRLHRRDGPIDDSNWRRQSLAQSAR